MVSSRFFPRSAQRVFTGPYLNYRRRHLSSAPDPTLRRGQVRAGIPLSVHQRDCDDRGDTDDDVGPGARLRIPSSHHDVRAVEQQVPHGVKDPADAGQDPTEERIGGDGEHGSNGVQGECHDGTLTADNS